MRKKSRSYLALGDWINLNQALVAMATIVLFQIVNSSLVVTMFDIPYV
jgi:hypothetical protein